MSGNPHQLLMLCIVTMPWQRHGISGGHGHFYYGKITFAATQPHYITVLQGSNDYPGILLAAGTAGKNLTEALRDNVTQHVISWCTVVRRSAAKLCQLCPKPSDSAQFSTLSPGVRRPAAGRLQLPNPCNSPSNIQKLS